VALVLRAELLDQRDKVVFLNYIGLVGTRHRRFSMGRPRKPPRDFTTDEALQKLFPPAVRREAKKTAKEATKKATNKESK